MTTLDAVLRNPTRRWRAVSGVACMVASLGFDALAAESTAEPRRDTPIREAMSTPVDEALDVTMFVGEARVIPQRNAGRLAVGSGQVVSAAVLDDREILLMANGPGVSSLHVWTRDGRSRRYKITVAAQPDLRVLGEIRNLLETMPNVRTRIVGTKLVIEGSRLSEEQINRIQTLRKHWDDRIVDFTEFQKDAPWERMVVFDVKVVEFSRERLRDLGVKWNQNAAGPRIGIAGDVARNRSVVPSSATAGNGVLVPASEGPQAVTPFHWSFGIASLLQSQLELYERRGDAIVLADPQLSARSGRAARFLSGGRIPYSVVGQNGLASVQFQDYGIQLELRPRVDDAGGIQAQIKAEISEPDPSLNPTSGVPGVRTRMAETVFNVRDGETMVLAGLVSRRGGTTVEQVPGLGTLPILGALFTSRRFERQETELVVFVTPRLLDPADESTGMARALERRAEDRWLEGVPGRDAAPAPAAPSEVAP